MFSKWGYETKVAIREMFKLYLKDDCEVMLWNRHGKVKYCRHCVARNIKQIIKDARKDSFGVYYAPTVCDCCGEDCRINNAPEGNIEY